MCWTQCFLIVRYMEGNKKIPLRVCWESKGGSNCCICEKCWRTILAIYAENSNSKDFDFILSKDGLKKVSNKMRYDTYYKLKHPAYAIIQNHFNNNCNKENLPKEIQWFYDIDLDKLVNSSIFRKVRNKIIRKFIY